ncbi:MAG: M50 family metallopeptidase [Myxococcaceae bacterium]
MKRAPPGQFDFAKLAALVGCVLLGIVLWDHPALWPLKLLVVMMHETGHALASLIVGGEVQRVVIAATQSGECLSLLPSGLFRQAVVSSAGYLGSAIVGAVLLISTFRFRARRGVLLAFCVWLAAMGALYAGDSFTLLFCLITAVACGLASRFLPDPAVDTVNLLLAAFSMLYTLMDLRDDLWISATRAQSDAGIIARATHVPSIIWAGLWSLIALFIVFGCAALSVRRTREPGIRLPAVKPLQNRS